MVFPTHMYCTTAKNIADMQSFEEAMAWGAVMFVKYGDNCPKLPKIQTGEHFNIAIARDTRSGQSLIKFFSGETLVFKLRRVA